MPPESPTQSLLKEVLTQIMDLKKNMVTKEDLGPINAQLTAFDKAIFKGNGKEPLMTRMDRVETQLMGIRENGCAYEQRQEADRERASSSKSFRDTWLWDILKTLISAGLIYLLLTLFPQVMIHLAK